MQEVEQEDMKSLGWLPPAKFGGNQNELHQTTGQAGDGQKLRKPNERGAHKGSDIESIYRTVPSSDGGRGIATAGLG